MQSVATAQLPPHGTFAGAVKVKYAVVDGVILQSALKYIKFGGERAVGETIRLHPYRLRILTADPQLRWMQTAKLIDGKRASRKQEDHDPAQLHDRGNS